MGSGGSITSTVRQPFFLIRRIVKGVVKGAEEGAKRSLYSIAGVYREGLKRGALELAPIKNSTFTTRVFGKRAGVYARRPKNAGTRPLFYTGHLAGGLVVKIAPPVYSLGFPEGAVEPYSKFSLSSLSAVQSRVHSIRGVYTRRQLAFLHWLMRKSGGDASKERVDWARRHGNAGVRVGTAYSRTVQARPALAQATMHSLPLIRFHFETALRRAITSAVTS